MVHRVLQTYMHDGVGIVELPVNLMDVSRSKVRVICDIDSLRVVVGRKEHVLHRMKAVTGRYSSVPPAVLILLLVMSFMYLGM